MARTFPALGLAGRRHRAERRRGAALALPRLQNARWADLTIAPRPDAPSGHHDDVFVATPKGWRIKDLNRIQWPGSAATR